MNMSILASLALLVQVVPTWALPEWAKAFWAETPPPTAWHRTWGILESIILGSWKQWNNSVLNSQLSTWTGQIMLTALALAATFLLVYKTTQVIKGRHRTLKEQQSQQSSSSIVHVHNKVQFRYDTRDIRHRERQTISLERYTDQMAIASWLTRLGM